MNKDTNVITKAVWTSSKTIKNRPNEFSIRHNFYNYKKWPN